MGILATLRNVSAALLVVVVAILTIGYDPRFTALLLPPFLMHYSMNTPGWLLEVPVVQLIIRVYESMISTFGIWGTRFSLVVAGAWFGLKLTEYMNGK